MKYSERNAALTIILSVIAFFVILLDNPAASHAAGFMDLELSIKELRQLVDKTVP